MIPPKTISHCLWRGLVNTINHDGIEHAGYLAFLGLLALFPFLVILVAVAGLMGEGEVGGEFVRLLFTNLPQHVASALRPRVDEIISGPPQGLLTLAIVGAIWTASSAVEGYRTVLNRAYHVNTPPAYLWRRLLSILQLLVFTIVVIVAMLLLVLAPAIWQTLREFFALHPHAAEQLVGPTAQAAVKAATISPFVVVGTVLALFAVVSNLYVILPNIKQKFKEVAPGAMLTVALWTFAAFLFSLYLSNFQQVNLIYGSLGGIIAALLFFYINNIIFIFGAEFNYLLMKAVGSRIVQKEATPEPLPKQEEVV